MFKTKLSTASQAVPMALRSWCELQSRGSATPFIFTVAGEEIPNASAATENGLLPLICWHADNIYRFAMGGRSMGVHFKTSARALSGFAVDLSRVDKPLSEVLCFMVEAAEDILKNSPASAAKPGAVEIEGIVHRFKADLEEHRQRPAVSQGSMPRDRKGATS